MLNPFPKCRTNWLAWMLICFGLIFGLSFILKVPPLVDENADVWQITCFLRGKYEHLPNISVPSTYFAAIAVIAKILHVESLTLFRLISFVGSICCIPVFYTIAAKLSPRDPAVRTLQFVFFPLIFPFFFLLYSDIWALWMFLVAVERAVAGKTWQSALAMGLAIAFRPPYVVFAVIPWSLLVAPNLSWTQIRMWYSKKVIEKSVPFLLIIIGFVCFVIWNHGVSMGDRELQHATINLPNVWVYLFCFFLLFLPNCTSVYRALNFRTRNHVFLIIPIIVIGFIIYWVTYHVSHPYNAAANQVVGGGEFLRNKILYYTVHGLFSKMLFFIPITVAVIGILRLVLIRDELKLLLPITSILSVLPFSVVEPRYYIPSFALFLLFRKNVTNVSERVNTVFYIIASLVLVFFIAKQLTFP